MKIRHALKHIFVPHEHNQYKPHFFREATVITLALVGVFLLGCSMGSSFFLKETVLGVNISTSVLVDLTNESRLAVNEAPLVRNPTLDAAASLKVTDMIQKDYFSHDSPEGVSPWHWFNTVGYKFLYAGENLAVNFTESSDVQKAWLNSPLHRDNLLNVHFKEIGMSAMEGMYKGAPTIYIVQLFGTPEEKKAIVKSEEPMKETATTSTSFVTGVGEKFALETTPGPGEVKGESDEVIVPIVQTSQLAIVKKVQKEDVTPSSATDTETLSSEDKSVNTSSAARESSAQPVIYATWYERGVFFLSAYIDYIYKALILLVLGAFSVLLLVEFRRQHYKHALYGVFLLMLFSILLTINTLFFT